MCILALVLHSPLRQPCSNLWFTVSFSYISCPSVFATGSLQVTTHIFLLHHHQNHSLPRCTSHVRPVRLFACLCSQCGLSLKVSLTLYSSQPVTSTFAPSSVVLHLGQFSPLENIWQWLKIFLITTWRKELPAGSGWASVLLNTLQCTCQSPSTKGHPVQNASRVKVGRPCNLFKILVFKFQFKSHLWKLARPVFLVGWVRLALPTLFSFSPWFGVLSLRFPYYIAKVPLRKPFSPTDWKLLLSRGSPFHPSMTNTQTRVWPVVSFFFFFPNIWTIE